MKDWKSLTRLWTKAMQCLVPRQRHIMMSNAQRMLVSKSPLLFTNEEGRLKIICTMAGYRQIWYLESGIVGYRRKKIFTKMQNFTNSSYETPSPSKELLGNSKIVFHMAHIFWIGNLLTVLFVQLNNRVTGSFHLASRKWCCIRRVIWSNQAFVNDTSGYCNDIL